MRALRTSPVSRWTRAIGPRLDKSPDTIGGRDSRADTADTGLSSSEPEGRRDGPRKHFKVGIGDNALLILVAITDVSTGMFIAIGLSAILR